MTDEEFYKNVALKVLKSIHDSTYPSVLAACYPQLEIEWNPNGEGIKNIKRKLILTEKTWYKRRGGALVYCIGEIRTTDCRSDKMVMNFLESGNLLHYDLSGSYLSCTKDTADIIRECTPEEVKEIEEKLREKNEHST